MIEQILLVPDWRLVVLEEIASRPPKFVVELNGTVQIMTEETLNEWRAKRDLLRRDPQYDTPRALTDV